MTAVADARTRIAPTGEVHPVAALFPMMTDEELDDLAADVRANGLLHPIVLDHDGVLIDGRNRLEACRRAGVAPRFVALPPGADPVAHILSLNIARRHLNAGQRALAVARARLVSNQSTRAGAKAAGTSQARVVQAAVVLEWAPEYAEPVLAGARSLDEAYGEAQHRKRTAELTAAYLETLRAEAPDLASLVADEQLPLGDALTQLRERSERERQQRQTTTRMVFEAVTALAPEGHPPGVKAGRLAAHLERGAFPDGSRPTGTRLRESAAVLLELARILDEEDPQ